MIEVKIVTLINKLQSKTRALALKSLNRRSIKAINQYNKQEEYVANSRDFLNDMEEQIEREYQEKDAAINAAYKQVQSM